MAEYVQYGRRTGRTSRQLAALPDGSILLVPSRALADHCRHLLREAGRSRSAIEFATPDNFLKFTGAVVPAVDADHVYWEATAGRPFAREAWDFIQCCVIPGR